MVMVSTVIVVVIKNIFYFNVISKMSNGVSYRHAVCFLKTSQFPCYFDIFVLLCNVNKMGEKAFCGRQSER